MNLAELRRRGFDESSHIPFTTRYRVKCSCCDALVINGHPCHENRCPNQAGECSGCGDIMPMDQLSRYTSGYYCEVCR